MIRTDLTRRRTLATAAGVTAAGLVPAGLLATPAAAAPQAPAHPEPLRNDELKEALRRMEARRRRVLTGRPSANGWEMEKEIDGDGSIRTTEIMGTRGPLTVAVRAGDPETVLIHVIRRFHYEVDTLGLPGEPQPVEGWTAPSKVRDSRLPESGRASGTAVVIRPGSYPPGARGNFTAGQVLVIRDILADTEGVVRWGGDDRRPYEGLFHLAVGPDDPRLVSVAARIRAWNETPGRGSGVLVDMAQPSRRRRAVRGR
ncbi:hypothetical protein K4B79_44755 [Streptomyces lincolnensis]|nr:hypothetical protein [Streptomyces lincolnensis]MCD7445279.1 hypothetical protein [Streptomyces lincolnensis]